MRQDRGPQLSGIAALLLAALLPAGPAAWGATFASGGTIASPGSSQSVVMFLWGGQRVVATLVCQETAPSTNDRPLDPVLTVSGPDGPVGSDDNGFGATVEGGVDCNTGASARVAFVAPASGQYTFLVEGADTTTGPFLLTRLVADNPVVGAGPGGFPRVRVLAAGTGLPLAGLLGDFFAYSPVFTGGVHVAARDVSGDGVPDLITGAGPGGGPHVRVIDGVTGADRMSFLAYDPGFTGGVFVAAGDVASLGSGAEIVVGPGPGLVRPVRVFNVQTGHEVRSFLPYGASFAGGVAVAVGDVDKDGWADIVTGAGPGGGPHVLVFSGKTGVVIRNFFAYAPAFAGGVLVAAGDVNGDGYADIITGPGPGGGPHVRAFDGATGAELLSFLAHPAGFTGGVTVGAGDVNADGKADIVTGAGPGGGPHVRVFAGATGIELLGVFAFDPGFTGGIFVGP
jgi:hypothetical protein